MHKHVRYDNTQLVTISDQHMDAELLSLAQRYSIGIFFETGTHLGNTVLSMAISGFFKKIHSIEISKSFLDLAHRSLSDNAARLSSINMSTIQLRLGDSAKCMPEILNAIDERCLFWLDAHYSGGIDGKADDGTECVLLNELYAIKNHYIKDHVIVIDDIGACIEGLKDWPALGDVCEVIKMINPQYCITIKYGRLFAEVVSSAHQYSKRITQEYSLDLSGEIKNERY